MGIIYKAQEKFEEAINFFKEALLVVEENNLAGKFHLEFKTSFREKSLFIYEELIQTLIENNRPAEALEYLERTKSRNFLELVSRLEVYPHAPEEIIEKDRKLKLELSSLQVALLKEQDTVKIDHFYSELQRQKEEYRKFITEIRKSYDPFYEPFMEVKTITFKEIQSLIDDSTAIIEFFFTSYKSRVFIVKKENEPRVISLDVPYIELYELFKDYVRAYVEYINKVVLTPSNWHNKMKKLLHLLYEKLFAGIEPELLGINKIIFIPHKILFIIPLHAIYKITDGKERYILEDYEISYSPSSQILKMCYDRKTDKKEKLFSFFCDTEGNLKNYKETGVKKIEKLFPDKNVTRGFIYEDISEKNTHKASILHFFCHGNFFPHKLLESGLSVFNHKGEKVFFTLKDILNKLSLKEAFMVVLTACETGMIKPELTDEYVGLPLGFITAGASSVISSLWSVRASPTADLIRMFHENIIIKGMNKPYALRQAQLEIIKSRQNISSGKIKPVGAQNIKQKPPDLSHPYYWAAFCCYGAD